VLSAAHFDQAIKLARIKSEPKKAAEFVVTQNPEDRQLPSPPLSPLFFLLAVCVWSAAARSHLPSLCISIAYSGEKTLSALNRKLAICSGYRGVGMAGMLAVAPF